MLGHFYGLKRQDIHGDAVQPGLWLDEYLLYIEHHKRMAATAEAGNG
jgi:uncharacterized cupin superfamily protein